MNDRKLLISLFLAFVLVLSVIAVGFIVKVPFVRGAAPLNEEAGQTVIELNAPTSESDPLVLMYSAKFACREAIQAGMYVYTTAAPTVSLKTEVLVHNPNDFPLTFYRKAVESSYVNVEPPTPGLWQPYILYPDYSIKFNCDDVAKLLTGEDTNFYDEYGIGVTVEGFLVFGVGPQTVDSQTRYTSLDVTAEYSRSSEVLKKDVHLQPWWTYWWWELPWELGHPYKHTMEFEPFVDFTNLPCRDYLIFGLKSDADDHMGDAVQREYTKTALDNGKLYDPISVYNQGGDAPNALVASIGRCELVTINDTPMFVADFVLFSNKGPTDPNPITHVPPLPVSSTYPWYPGHWYDIPVVMPQNVATDLDDYYREWFSQRWIDLGVSHPDVGDAMEYFIPYWSNWGYWYWWWNGGESVSVGVGDGESLDVEQIMPTRVIMTTWPPP